MKENGNDSTPPPRLPVPEVNTEGSSTVSAQEGVEDVAKEAKAKALDVKDEATREAKETGARLKDQAQSTFHETKEQLAGQLAGVARAFRSSSEALHSEDQEGLAHFQDRLAEQLEEVANYLHNKDASGLLEDVRRLAQRQPVLFVGGLFAVGLLAGQLLRNTEQPNRHQTGS